MYGIADPWQRLLGCVTEALLRTAVLPPAGTTQPPTPWTFYTSVNMTQVKSTLVFRSVASSHDPDSVGSVSISRSEFREAKMLHQKRKKEMYKCSSSSSVGF